MCHECKYMFVFGLKKNWKLLCYWKQYVIIEMRKIRGQLKDNR